MIFLIMSELYAIKSRTVTQSYLKFGTEGGQPHIYAIAQNYIM